MNLLSECWSDFLINQIKPYYYMYIKYNIITRAYCEKGIFVVQSNLSQQIHSRVYVRKESDNRAYMLLARRARYGGLRVARIVSARRFGCGGRGYGVAVVRYRNRRRRKLDAFFQRSKR